MKLHLSVMPVVQSVKYVDEQVKQFLQQHDIPFQREIVFIVHELLINAIEAMKTCNNKHSNEIEIRLEINQHVMHLQVIDGASGIALTEVGKVLNASDAISLNERGRGFLFIQHMADRIFFETLQDQRFAVCVEKLLK